MAKLVPRGESYPPSKTRDGGYLQGRNVLKEVEWNLLRSAGSQGGHDLGNENKQAIRGGQELHVRLVLASAMVFLPARVDSQTRISSYQFAQTA